MEVVQRDDRCLVDRESGDVHLWQQFDVRRSPTSEVHRVQVRSSWDSGTPQQERCDCAGFRYRRRCGHIDAVYEAGVLRCWALE